MKWSNLTLWNIYFFFQGYWRLLMYKVLYKVKAKLWRYEESITMKQTLCGSCWEKGQCEVCGCSIVPMFFSSKSCPKGKW